MNSAEMTHASSEAMGVNSRSKQIARKIVMSKPQDQISPIRSPMTHLMTQQRGYSNYNIAAQHALMKRNTEQQS